MEMSTLSRPGTFWRVSCTVFDAACMSERLPPNTSTSMPWLLPPRMFATMSNGEALVRPGIFAIIGLSRLMTSSVVDLLFLLSRTVAPPR